jgi:hypothetical protein
VSVAMYLFFPFLQHGVREVSNYLSNVLEINWTYRTVLNKNYLILRYVNFEYVLFRTRILGQHFLDISKNNYVNQPLVSLININY